MVFKPTPCRSRWEGLIACLWILLIDTWLFTSMIRRPIDGIKFILIVLIVLSLPLLYYFAYRTWGTFTLEYWLDRNAITIRWADVRQVIPLNAIRGVIQPSESTPNGVQRVARRSWWQWPSPYVDINMSDAVHMPEVQATDANRTGTHASVNTTGTHASVYRTGVHTSVRNTGVHSAVNTTGLHPTVNTTGVHTSVHNTGVHTAVNTTGVHTSVHNTGIHTAVNTTGVHPTVNTTGTHTAVNATGLHRSVNTKNRTQPLTKLFASQRLSKCLLIDVGNVSYAISPQEPDAFLNAMQDRYQVGAALNLQLAQFRSSWWEKFFGKDRLGVVLLGIGVLGSLILFGALMIPFPMLPENISFEYNSDGFPEVIRAKSALFLLPGIGLLSWIANGLWGMWMASRDQLVGAYLLWGGTVVVQICAFLALINLIA